MRGDLSRTNAADACRELSRHAATGLLAIEGPDGPGTISIVDGRIVAASSPTPRARLGDRLVGASYLDEQDLADALRLQRSGEGHARLGVLLVERGLVSRDAVRLFIQEQLLDALFDILRWRFGSFEFIHGEATEVLEVPLSIAVDEILVEVARRQQEWAELSQVIPDLESVPSFRVGASSASAALEPDEFAVLASVDGERSIRALASDLGYGEFEAARIVYGLCLLGIVEVRLPEDEVGAAFDDAFSTGAPVEHAPATDEPAADADEPAADADEPAAEADGEDAVDVEAAGAELDVELSALIAELTGARPSDEPPTSDDGHSDWIDRDEPGAGVPDLGPDTDVADGGSRPGSPDADLHDHERSVTPEEPASDGDWTEGAPPDDAEAEEPEPFEAHIDRGSSRWQPRTEPDDEREDAAKADVTAHADDAAPADDWGTDPDDWAAGPTPAPPTDAGEWDTGPIPTPAAGGDSWGDGPHDWTPLPDQRAGSREQATAPTTGPRAYDGPSAADSGAVRDVSPVDYDRVEDPQDADDLDPVETPAPSEAADPSETSDPTEAADPARAPEPAADNGDVSEFLRELSRLALDPEDSPKPRPSGANRPDQRGPSKRDDDKPKKRGLFGWGG